MDDEVVMRVCTDQRTKVVTVIRLASNSIEDLADMGIVQLHLRPTEHFMALPPGAGVNKWIFKHDGVAYMGDPLDFERVPPLEILAGLEKIKPRPRYRP